MNDKELQIKMDDDIKQRLENPDWDSSISIKILSAFSRKRKSRYVAASISSMAAAAVIIIAFLFIPDTKTALEYEQLIQNQLDGTYKEVFNEQYISSYSYGNEEYDNIDILIDYTLLKR